MTGTDFAAALSDQDDVKVTVVRRKDGTKRTLPVWFVVEGRTLHLLPMYGLKTKWFRDLEGSGKLSMTAGGRSMDAIPKIVKDKAAVDRAKGRFGEKYGKEDVAKYYPTSEVALEIGV